MSILAAKCPCCGRDIGFEKDIEEVTCVFCGARLKVAALKTETVEPPAQNAKPSESNGASDPSADKGSQSSEHHRSEHHHGEHHHGEHHHSEHHHSEHHHGEHHHGEHRESVREVNAPELTEEEIAEELKRKAEFKDELHTTVHQINDLRARRPKLQTKLRTISTLGIVGAILAVGAGLAIFLFAEGDSENTLLMIISGVVALIALAMLITSAVRRGEIKKQQSRLEESILEKKQKRDILIGRLNKINKTLHISEM